LQRVKATKQVACRPRHFSAARESGGTWELDPFTRGNESLRRAPRAVRMRCYLHV
jgi:hypothetical protein